MLLFNLAQGLENLECYLKMGKTNFGACARGNVIFDFIKARNEQNLKFFVFPHTNVQVLGKHDEKVLF